MTESYLQVIREHASPLDLQPTDEKPKLGRLPNIKAVIFDIYGTMLMSGSGEVGTAATENHHFEAIQTTLQAHGVDTTHLPTDFGLEATIRQHHDLAREADIEFPEVDILAVWKDALAGCAAAGQLNLDQLDLDYSQIALEYECRVNPVWPMPNLENCLDALRGEAILGVISNAQFFTPLLFPALMMRTLDDMGFKGNIQFFSYKFRDAKPSLSMFNAAVDELKKEGISAQETLYLGNDMLNDISTAAKCGMKTALFAGDARSLRHRQGDSRVQGCSPDLVLTDLSQLANCIL